MDALTVIIGSFGLVAFFIYMALNLNEDQKVFKLLYFGVAFLLVVVAAYQLAILPTIPQTLLNYTNESSFYWNCSKEVPAPAPPEKNCTNISWWLEMEEGTDGYGTFLYDACPTHNDFMRAGQTEQEPAVWHYGQHLGAFDDDWAVMQNTSAFTTGSRSWRTIINFTWRYGTGFYSDNETLYGQDWANFMTWEGDEGFWCYCRQADTGLRATYAAVPLGQFVDVLCSYDAEDSGRLTIYVNGTAISSNTGALCDYQLQQGEAVIDSYPVVGVMPRLDAIYDETLYRTQSTNPLEAYCLWSTNTFDCTGEPTENETTYINGTCDSVLVQYNYGNYSTGYEPVGGAFEGIAFVIMTVTVLLFLYIFLFFLVGVLGNIGKKGGQQEENDYARPF